MYFDSFAEFLAMGRHGIYVWLSYGFFLLVIVWNLLMPLLSKRRALERARRYWMHQRGPYSKPRGQSHETH